MVTQQEKQVGNSMPGEKDKSLVYAWYIVIICMIAYIFSFIDRQILALLIQPIRKDLHISDTQFSLLHGLAFSIFFSTMGIPIARLADRKSRPLIISVGVFFWSLMTAFCGLGRNFLQLFISRMGVGVGEAALAPPTYSMIRDFFPKEKMGLALSVFSLGAVLGSGIAYLVGGAVIKAVSTMGAVSLPFVGELTPWRVAFLIVGLPGLIIALILFLTVKDPERKGLLVKDDTGNIAAPAEVSFSEVLHFIWAHKGTFSGIYLGVCCTSIIFYGMLTWTPAFYLRNFKFSIFEISLYLGSLILIFSTLGMLFSGWLLDFMYKRGYEDAAMRTAIIGSIGIFITIIVYPLCSNFTLSLVFLAPALFFNSFPFPAATAAMQLLTPSQMRAQVSAIFLLLLNVIALGFGTTLIALSTDYLFKNDAAVGKSLALIGGIFSLMAIILEWRSLKHYRNSMKETAHYR